MSDSTRQNRSDENGGLRETFPSGAHSPRSNRFTPQWRSVVPLWGICTGCSAKEPQSSVDVVRWKGRMVASNRGTSTGSGVGESGSPGRSGFGSPESPQARESVVNGSQQARISPETMPEPAQSRDQHPQPTSQAGRRRTPTRFEAPSIPGLSYLQHLGSGGYADVFLYQQAMPSRRVAVKVLRETNLSRQALTQFRTEANAMATLAHPNIVPVYSASITADGRPYLVMMHYPRASLGERVKKERFTVAESIQLAIKLASAIETAHRAGILHRDIKPANVLTDQYGNPGLGDFGIAAEVSAADEQDLGISVPWSPPELLYATEAPSVSSDVYSLAATLWHVLVGRSPFEVVGGDNSQFALMKRIRDKTVPETGRADVPKSLERLLTGAMSKNPILRPATALDFARSLQAIEQELRLPRTEVVIALDETGHTGSRVAPLEDATRAKAQRIDPTAGAVGSDAFDYQEQGGNTAGQAVHSFLLDDDTGTRTQIPGRVQETPTHEQGSGITRKHLVIGVAGAVTIVLIVVLVLYLVGKRVDPPALPDPTPSAIVPEIAADLPPGKLQFSDTRNGGEVTISWTYDNPLKDDTFFWKETETGEPRRLEHPSVTLNGAPEGQVCIWVRVVRFSGNNSQTQFTKGCTR